MVHGVSIVWFPVSDVGRAVDFYSGTLGLDVTQQEDEWAELEVNDLRIGLNARESEGGTGGGVLAFQPSDGVEDAVEELEAAGVEFPDGITEHPWGRIASFHDPDGNDLQLYEPPVHDE
jgi:predicted enzyme related to lactoylglutathione lyase